MNTERAEKLFLAIGGVSDLLIRQAEDPRAPKRKPAWGRWAAMAAAVALVAGAGLYGIHSFLNLLPLGGAGSGGAGIRDNDAAPGALAFMSYAGPALPLTVLDGPEGLPATREVTWDFFTVDAEQYSLKSATVTDVTVIRNDDGDPLTITLAYPVTADLQDKEDAFPTLTVDGNTPETSLVWGDAGCSDGDYPTWSPRLESWEDCKTLLADGSYLARAREDAPALEQTVTVWEFTGSARPEVKDGAPTLAVSFQIDQEKTQVYTWGFNGAELAEDGGRRYSYFLPRTDGQDSRRLIIFLGEVPEEYTLQGYRDGGCDQPLEGVTPRIGAFTTTLGEMLDRLVEEYLTGYYDPPAPLASRLEAAKAAARRMMARFLPEERRYDYFTMEDLISHILASTRVVWTTAEVTIPARDEITVTARYRKDPSFDFACANRSRRGIYGFDLATSLGSALRFTAVTARLEGAEGLVVERQNLGFDLTRSITQVALDPGEEYYYMEVRWKEE